MNNRARKHGIAFFACFPTLLGSLAFLPSLSAHAQSEAIGHVITLTGAVEAVSRDGSSRRLERGAELREGDLVITGPAAQAQIRMRDGALLALRPDTEFEFHQFSYDGPDGAGDSAI